ncbi:MAG: bifunctional (p)ppGpp synthetase/guanosine-3',5'-bis(diphosphate) 3'-pyrophosphohydrolase [Chloroflexi bacterium]|nr:bifunctional (p)ppGpp synthetase/guanosine-3',5'-bis(diphosphate) 3'-pyrophosphohydrolase [Chloroflexota bacterium]
MVEPEGPSSVVQGTERLSDLLVKVRAFLPEDKVGVLQEAYQFASHCHEGQMRQSGEPFIEHPLSTARYLAELRLDSTTLVAALLHDVVEDCGVSLEEVEQRFGPDVSRLVDGVTKLTRMDIRAVEGGDGLRRTAEDSHQHAESVRKMLVAMAQDIRVVLIKLADRLHNMRTLQALSPDRRVAIAQETLDIYAPLAHRLGMWDIKWRLEDLAFRYLQPNKYREISHLLTTKRAEREQYVQKVTGVLKTELAKASIRAEISGRPKHLYSIYKKISKYSAQGKEFSDIYDLFAVRVLVNGVREAYSALGVVHGLWHPIPGQFDDYIANPKDNMYQALHTTVICLEGVPIEIQIRTRDMHRIAEYGVAAHWRYKEGGAAKDMHFEQKMTWLRQLLEWQREVSGAEEFLESVKTDVFQDQVFVYTPKGDIKELPAGSTPIDFAYHIHTDLGHRCVGAKVNGKLVPLDHQLHNGDTVEVLASKTARGPTLDWLNPHLGYVRSAAAREKIRQWFRKQERGANIQRGRDLFHKELHRLNLAQNEEDVVRLLKLDSVDDLLAALGSGALTVAQLVARLAPQQEERGLGDYHGTVSATGPSSGVQVLGVGDLLTRMARCCNPLPGDAITGFVTRTSGVTVHRKGCANLLGEDEPERLVRVEWGKSRQLYPVRVNIEAWDRVGLLRDITSVVSGEGVNIAAAHTEEHEDGTSSTSLTVHIGGTEQLTRLFSKLEGVKGVRSVSRSAPALSSVAAKPESASR